MNYLRIKESHNEFMKRTNKTQTENIKVYDEEKEDTL